MGEQINGSATDGANVQAGKSILVPATFSHHQKL